MQPYHAEAIVNEGGIVTLSLPYRRGQKVEILVLPWEDEKKENEAWAKLGLDQFLAGYSEEDGAYDHYDEWLKKRNSAQ
jgi:hypothetical protein